jgi:hypothetical protein
MICAVRFRQARRMRFAFDWMAYLISIPLVGSVDQGMFRMEGESDRDSNPDYVSYQRTGALSMFTCFHKRKSHKTFSRSSYVRHRPATVVQK